eukprot:TRINITY_DN16457_c0_g3_i1.p2 TRINITY_DN16457_c0_g3~~TRINITY_DN16457_c0_g3_i1.p2  ORF type:complete len:228 (+),score=59.78 TRINITY_DN16457_c0_g3_i1:53-736(+)
MAALTFTLPSIAPKAEDASKKTVKRQRGAADAAFISVPGADSDQQKILLTVARLSLRTAQEARQVKGALIETYIVDENSEQVRAMNKATQDYSTKAATIEASSRPHCISLPYHHAWSALLEVLGKKLEGRHLELHKEYVAHMAGSEQGESFWTKMDQEIKVVRVCKCYAKNKKKVEIMLTPGSKTHTYWLQAGKKAFISLGSQLKMGQAPKGDQEGKLQELLEKLDI